jgi:hypothetical protein
MTKEWEVATLAIDFFAATLRTLSATASGRIVKDHLLQETHQNAPATPITRLSDTIKTMETGVLIPTSRQLMGIAVHHYTIGLQERFVVPRARDSNLATGQTIHLQNQITH